MKTALFTIVVAITLITTGCATTENYEKILQSWVGNEEINLVRLWGPPMNSYEAGGSKFIVYNSSSNIHLPGTDPTYSTNCYSTGYSTNCYTSTTGGTEATNIALSCQTTFEIKNSRIVSWRWQGNNCTALE